MKNYRVRDRVNSVRGPGVDPRNPDREVRYATGATEENADVVVVILEQNSE